MLVFQQAGPIPATISGVGFAVSMDWLLVGFLKHVESGDTKRFWSRIEKLSYLLTVYPQSSVEQQPDDFKLIEAFRRGEEKAFEEIVRRYQRQVANIIYLTLGSREEVDDLSQEVFVRVFRSLERFEFDSSLYSWIYRIAVNLCIDEIRKKRIRKLIPLEFMTEKKLEAEKRTKETATGSDELLLNEKKEVIRKALEKLSPVHRTVMLLREYQDLSYGEIAKTLRISPQAVKSRIFRAREELREMLKDYFQERI